MGVVNGKRNNITGEKTMNTLHTQQEWFDRLLPEGRSRQTGPGGSGDQSRRHLAAPGGAAWFLCLCSIPTTVSSKLARNIELDLDDYQDRVFHRARCLWLHRPEIASRPMLLNQKYGIRPSIEPVVPGERARHSDL